MEVHTHTHAGRKKWTEYFWEFLMLFLAVFAGFLAENRREDMVEKKRAHQFLESMLVDVKTNIKNLDSLIAQDNIYLTNYDSLVNWLLDQRARRYQLRQAVSGPTKARPQKTGGHS